MKKNSKLDDKRMKRIGKNVKLLEGPQCPDSRKKMIPKNQKKKKKLLKNFSCLSQ